MICKRCGSEETLGRIPICDDCSRDIANMVANGETPDFPGAEEFEISGPHDPLEIDLPTGNQIMSRYAKRYFFVTLGASLMAFVFEIPLHDYVTFMGFFLCLYAFEANGYHSAVYDVRKKLKKSAE